jgi:hypothetical protein
MLPGTSERIRCECGALVPAAPPGAGQTDVRCDRCGRLVWSEATTTEPGGSGDDRFTASRPAEEPPPFDADRALREIRRPELRLCSPTAVAVGTFLCGPLAGFLLMAYNDRRLRRRGRGWGMLLAGLVFSLTLALLPDTLFDAPTAAHWFLAAVFNVILFRVVAGVLYGRVYREHTASGGESASGAVLVGLSLLGMVLYFGLAFGAGSAWEAVMEARVTVGPGSQVVYTRGVTEAEARRLGEVLVELGLFTGADQEVRLERRGAGYEISFSVEGVPDRAEYQTLAGELAAKAFDGKPVRIRVCNFLGRAYFVVDS